MPRDVKLGRSFWTGLLNYCRAPFGNSCRPIWTLFHGLTPSFLRSSSWVKCPLTAARAAAAVVDHPCIINQDGDGRTGERVRVPAFALTDALIMATRGPITGAGGGDDVVDIRDAAASSDQVWGETTLVSAAADCATARHGGHRQRADGRSGRRPRRSYVLSPAPPHV
jgi:hypothetical protein